MRGKAEISLVTKISYLKIQLKTTYIPTYSNNCKQVVPMNGDKKTHLATNKEKIMEMSILVKWLIKNTNQQYQPTQMLVKP